MREPLFRTGPRERTEISLLVEEANIVGGFRTLSKCGRPLVVSRPMIERVIKRLVADGKLVDSGHKRLSERSGRMETVWVVQPEKQ